MFALRGETRLLVVRGAPFQPVSVTVRCSPVEALVRASFGRNAEGWRIEKNGEIREPVWKKDDGVLYDKDAGTQVWYWVSGPRFGGDRSSAYGGLLCFDLRLWQAAVVWCDAPDIRLVAADGIELSLSGVLQPDLYWRTYRVVLDERVGWLHGSTPATAAQLRAVLTDLAAIKIRGDLGAHQGDACGLDEVRILKLSKQAK